MKRMLGALMVSALALLMLAQPAVAGPSYKVYGYYLNPTPWTDVFRVKKRGTFNIHMSLEKVASDPAGECFVSYKLWRGTTKIRSGALSINFAGTPDTSDQQATLRRGNYKV